MRVSVTVGSTTREMDLQHLLRHPHMEMDAKECVSTQLISMFESALGDEWTKVRAQINEVCDAMGWGHTR